MVRFVQKGTHAWLLLLSICSSPTWAIDHPLTDQPIHREQPDSPYLPLAPLRTSPLLAPFGSVQVNTNALGMNILGDAANEPSLAVDPTDPSRIVIGWRQFDNVTSNFRQAGWAYSTDGGLNWTFPGVLEPGVFRSDPVLNVSPTGEFYYNSLRVPGYICDVFRSANGGQSWPNQAYAFGGDKAWMTVDHTNGMGRGNIYCAWNSGVGCCSGRIFTRSTDGGLTWMEPIGITGYTWLGTLSVGPGGELYVVGGYPAFRVVKSVNAQDPSVTPSFGPATSLNLGGGVPFGDPNPEGTLGQPWIVTDHSTGPNHGNVYVLSTTGSSEFWTDIRFVRSTNGGTTWSPPIRVTDDPPDGNIAHWFGTLSISPNGRLDAIWNDNRESPNDWYVVRTYYSYSIDGGQSWSANYAFTPPWNVTLGYPNQQKIGDYYHMVSDDTGANLAYAATFNGEQDVYFVRLLPNDCNRNGQPDDQEIATGASHDCNANQLPDECEADCNHNGYFDDCDLADGQSQDCNFNSIPDECDISSGTAPDCNTNGIPDSCDISSGASTDCDLNSVPDSCDLATGAPDCNQNMIPDICDVQSGFSEDCNSNLVPDSCESGHSVDCNANSVIDLCEIGIGTARDCNRDGVLDECEMLDEFADCDGNGQYDSCELLGPHKSLLYDSSDRVRIPRNSELEPATELTVELWMLETALSSGTRYFFQTGSFFGPGFTLSGSTQLEFWIREAQFGTAIIRDPTPLSAYRGQWHHIAITYSSVLNTRTLFVDGLIKATGPSLGLLSYANDNLYLGGSLANGFRGQIDEVRYWRTARAQQQIQDFMHRRLDGNEAGLIAYYNFDTDAGQTVLDASGNGNHGSLGDNTNPGGDPADPTIVAGGAPLVMTDCNQNSTLDVCEVDLPDCNQNGTFDTCDLVSGAAFDCNQNMIPDSCDIASGISFDCNANGIPDSCDLQTGTPDCNQNGVPDSCDIASGASPDCNQNHIPDLCDLASGFSRDCNMNGVPDTCDIASSHSIDCDSDSIPNECDPDTMPPSPNPPFLSFLALSSTATSVHLRSFALADCQSPEPEYFFDFTSVAGGTSGHDSLWQLSADYVDTGLSANALLRYRVRGRDRALPSPNLTGYSSEIICATAIQSPSHVVVTRQPPSTLTATAVGPFSNMGFGNTGFYFEVRPLAAGPVNQWVASSSITLNNVSQETAYLFRVKARNWQGSETAFTPWRTLPSPNPWAVNP